MNHLKLPSPQPSQQLPTSPLHLSFLNTCTCVSPHKTKPTLSSSPIVRCLHKFHIPSSASCSKRNAFIMKPFFTLPSSYKPSLPPLTPPPMSSYLCLDKVIVIMGPTGSGKTRLSIDLASELGNSEIINSDKIQMYSGLDITTNKVCEADRRNITHHYLGVVDPLSGVFSDSDFRISASKTISDIISRNNIPIIAGGSNSYILSLLVDQFEPALNFFETPQKFSNVLRYNCCFLWMDVEFEVLSEYLVERVDEMLDSGMFEELSEYYRSGSVWAQEGLRKAIGVPEFEKYFEKYPPGSEREWDEVRRGEYEEAVRLIKENTCELALRQMKKIGKLKEGGWDIQKLDATSALNQALKRRNKRRWNEIWQHQVVNPGMKIVRDFL